jgi:hypothetical protein
VAELRQVAEVEALAAHLHLVHTHQQLAVLAVQVLLILGSRVLAE